MSPTDRPGHDSPRGCARDVADFIAFVIVLAIILIVSGYCTVVLDYWR